MSSTQDRYPLPALTDLPEDIRTLILSVQDPVGAGDRFTQP